MKRKITSSLNGKYRIDKQIHLEWGPSRRPPEKGDVTYFDTTDVDVNHPCEQSRVVEHRHTRVETRGRLSPLPHSFGCHYGLQKRIARHKEKKVVPFVLFFSITV